MGLDAEQGSPGGFWGEGGARSWAHLRRSGVLGQCLREWDNSGPRDLTNGGPEQ